MIATYHNHTTYSDGKHTPSALADAGVRLGVDELGISDHFVLHRDGRSVEWSMPIEALQMYIDELSRLRAKFHSAGGPSVRLGLEVDWFPEHGELLRDTLHPLPLDYIIGSVHYIDAFSIDGSPAAWQKLSECQRNDMHRAYWQQMIGLAECGVFDIVAHIDLTKKFGFSPTVDLSAEIDAALDAIAAQQNLVVEINTAGWHKPCGDAYPSEDIVCKCFDRGISMTISADAHQGDHLLRDFDRAAQRLTAAGYTEIARFAERTMRMESMDVALAPK